MELLDPELAASHCFVFDTVPPALDYLWHYAELLIVWEADCDQ